MSIATPLTAGSEIQRSHEIKTSIGTKEKPLTTGLGIFAKDVVEISQLGLNKLQKETQIEASRNIDDIANEVVRISSSIGRAQSMGNLTNSQATNLYQKIASLL